MGDRMREKGAKAIWDSFPRQRVGMDRRTYDDLLDHDKEAWRRMNHAALDACHFDELVNGCNALLGLLQLICARGDIPPAIKKAIETGHRVEEARAVLKKVEASDG